MENKEFYLQSINDTWDFYFTLEFVIDKNKELTVKMRCLVNGDRVIKVEN